MSSNSEADGQRHQPPEREGLPPFHLLRGQGQAGQAAQERADSDLPFQPGQRRAQTEVDAPAERCKSLAIVATAPKAGRPFRVRTGTLATGDGLADDKFP